MLHRVKVIFFIVMGLSLSLQHTAGFAQTFPEVYVFGEDDGANNISCSASSGSAVAAVQAALRGNGIAVTDSDYVSAMKAYVNVNVIKFADTCAVNVTIQFKSYQLIDDRYAQKNMAATILYCHRSFIFYGNRSYVYSTMLDTAKDMTNQCVSEIYRDTFRPGR